MMVQKVTISDVAAHTGVSTSTVSHALSGRRKISDKVRQKIFDAVTQLNYRPSYAAQVMNTKRTMLIGVLTDQSRNPSSGVLFEALQNELVKHCYSMVLGVAGLDESAGRAMLTKFSTGMVDGIINMLPQIETNEAKHICAPVPVVTYQRQDSAPVYINYEDSICKVMEYLWSLGHRRIGFVTSETRTFGGIDPTLTGFKRFLSGKNVDFDEQLIYAGRNDIDSGIIAAERFCRQGVSAIFAGNDQMAVGVYQWAYTNGVKIPKDISVVGFDDSPLATAVFPQLTTVQLPLVELASHTVESLMRKIDGGTDNTQTKIINPSLVIRKSTATAKPILKI